jgi:hypothetical protein
MNLEEANKILNINKQKVVFVYSAPKVGSTSVVSSLRLFCIDKMDIIHVHDEDMLKVLTKINNTKINDIIEYNNRIGKEVYVLNIYRSPIERKISTFFEKIGSYHFNNNDQEVNKYSIERVIKRFNDIFPWIGEGDHFMDKYPIDIPKFDTNAKYVLVCKDNIRYISLRLSDSLEWHNILTSIFGSPIRIIKDYESNNKEIKDLYNLFKEKYRIPLNLLNNILTDKYLNYYYSESELHAYYSEWLSKSTDMYIPFTENEYKLYERVTIENSHIDFIQTNHYFYDGCICKACDVKRSEIVNKLLRGETISGKIMHCNAKMEFIGRRLKKPKRKVARKIDINLFSPIGLK